MDGFEESVSFWNSQTLKLGLYGDHISFKLSAGSQIPSLASLQNHCLLLFKYLRSWETLSSLRKAISPQNGSKTQTP